MRTLTIGKNDAGQRADKFLQKALYRLTGALLYRFLREKRIKRNGKRLNGGDLLAEGDLLTLFIPDEFFAPPDAHDAFLRCTVRPDILYEDDNLLLLHKPVGLLCHEDEQERVQTLLCAVQKYLYDQGVYNPQAEQSFAPALANRIDRNTGGIVAAAKNVAALRELNAIFKAHELQKLYLTLVFGRVGRDGEHSAWLRKDAERNQVVVSAQRQPGSKPITTRWRVLEASGACSCL